MQLNFILPTKSPTQSRLRIHLNKILHQTNNSTSINRKTNHSNTCRQIQIREQINCQPIDNIKNKKDIDAINSMYQLQQELTNLYFDYRKERLQDRPRNQFTQYIFLLHTISAYKLSIS